MRRSLLLALSALLAFTFVLPVTTAAAPPARDGLLTDMPVTGTLSDGTAFTGTATITEITRSGSDLLFDGVIEDATGTVVGTFTDVVGTLQDGNGARCDILFLDLGAINLDLLGLVVDISPITIDIFAEPGPGNLLGNLLCAVVGLLDGGLDLGGVIDRLLGLVNRLLG